MTKIFGISSLPVSKMFPSLDYGKPLLDEGIQIARRIEKDTLQLSNKHGKNINLTRTTSK